MTDEGLRQLIREAVARHTGSSPRTDVRPDTGRVDSLDGGRVALSDPLRPSMAFSLYVVPRPAGETDCVIEPGTRCDHCGYCLSHGH